MSEFNLREQPYVLVTVRAYRAAEPTENGGGRGITTLRFSVAPVENADGSRIGSVSSGHGYVVINDHRRESMHEQEFLIPLDDIWCAYDEALEDAEYLHE